MSRQPLESADHAWFIAQRWQAYAAEGRANLLRIIAVGAFYLVHLWSYLSSNGQLRASGLWQVGELGAISKQFHILVTLLAAAWALLALGILLALQQRIFPRWLPYFSTGCDIVLLTSIICSGSAARSPLIVGYFLILVLATLRLDLSLIRFATGGCALAYLCVLGCAKWPATFGIDALTPTGMELRVPRYHQLIVMLAILLGGVMLGQIVRHVRHLAEQFAQRAQDLTSEP